METWFEIFKTGTHTDSRGNTRTWTENDLDTIASNYNKAEREAPIVIGHPEGSAPAYGWIARLKRAGEKLLAAAKQIMPEFAELVNKGRYKKVSIGLTPENMLHHVAFLGAAPPAVHGLADATFAEESLLTAVVATTDENTHPAGEEQETDPATASEVILSSGLAAFTERLQALENTVTQLMQGATNTPKPEHVFAESASELQSLLSNAISAGKITPAQKSIALQLFSLLTTDEIHVAQIESGNTQSITELVKQFLDLQEGHKLFTEMPNPGNMLHEHATSDFERVRGIIHKSMNAIE